LGYIGNKPLLINTIQSLWSLVITFIFITFLIDRLGRRTPLVVGPLAMAGFLAWQAGVGSQFKEGAGGSPSLGIAGIAFIFLYSASFSMSYGPVSCEFLPRDKVGKSIYIFDRQGFINPKFSL
jgi:hypothetical protein